MNFLTFIEQEKYSFIIISILLIIYIIKILSNYKKEKEYVLCHENLDVLKYIASILIIIFHLSIYTKLKLQTDFLFMDILARLAVPLFFMIAGYFISQNENKGPDYIKSYLKELFKTYLFWSIIYLPLGLKYIIDLKIAWYLIPLALVIGFSYIGIYYHLWYFPALFLAIILLFKWKKKFSLKSLLFVSFLLLLLGSSESYFGYFNSFWQNIFETFYFSIFYTTRNFLFFGLFYLTLGYYLQKKNYKWTKDKEKYLLLSSCIFIFDCMVSQMHHGLDSNILATTPFLVTFLFLKIIYFKKLLVNFDKRKLRAYSKYYFLVHPLVLESFFYFNRCQNLFFIILMCLLLTHLLTLICLKIKNLSVKLKPN